MKIYSLLTTNYSLVFALALTSCTPVSTLTNMAETASGKINQVKKNMEETVQPVVDTAHSVNNRVKEVQNGLSKIQEGMNQIRGTSED